MFAATAIEMELTAHGRVSPLPATDDGAAAEIAAEPGQA
jgi:hypothetical protein